MLMTIGACGMYIVPVVLPVVQAEFGVARAEAAMPYSMLMIGFGIGGLLMGRLADRYGVMVPLLIGAAGLGSGFALAATTHSLTGFMLAHGMLIGLLGSASMFAPLIADTSLWWVRRRGIAVAICASGNYLGGAIWPPVIQHSVEQFGWRNTYFMLAVFCFVVVTVLAVFMRRRPPELAPHPDPLALAGARRTGAAAAPRPLGLMPLQAQVLLCIAAVACCVAMSMPQVHIVAYCADLGYGAARGAQMLSIMLAFGIASRLISGAVCDRIGGLRTLLLGSMLQGIALLLFLPFDSLVSRYVIAALFGLFQGGIVPSYAIIIREHFPASEAGARVGLVLMCSLFGMALGGWMSGKVFDLTGSYHAAFLNGIGWNALNLTIAFFLLYRTRLVMRRGVRAPAA
jgi:MFS family permease